MKIFTSVHVLLLLYVVVALVFWEFSLQKQSRRIFEQDVHLLFMNSSGDTSSAAFRDEYVAIRKAYQMRTRQYIGEGSTFLVVILIGAFVVYKSFQRRMLFSKQQNNFMLSVTHELKTPIAGIKLNLQTLQKRKLDEEKTGRLLEQSIREANRLNDLCNNMLYASRLEGRQYQSATEVLDLSALANECAADYMVRYPGRFETDITGGVLFTGDKMMLQIALNNLLENAVKYTPVDKKIELRLALQRQRIILQITDEGAGVPDKEKRKIFNKFYRVGNEESRKSKGTGLGLYLTNKIVQQHNGHICVKDNTPAGAIFEISLPARVEA